MAESVYQKKLIRRLRRMFPGCEVLKNDEQYRQGILDLSIFWGPHWAMLEVKDHEGASMQPNQQYYIDRFNKMSFAAKIYPENEEEVLAALQEAFSSRGATCVPQS